MMPQEELTMVGRTLTGIYTAGASLILSFADGMKAFCRPIQETESGSRRTRSKHPRVNLAVMFSEILSPGIAGAISVVPIPDDARAGLNRCVLTVEAKETGMELSFDEGYKLFVSPVEGIQFTKDGRVLGAGNVLSN